MIGPETDYKINKKFALNLQTEMFYSFAPAKKCTCKNLISNVSLISRIKILV
jgi:hypothetical protein